jgi:hypothetical protein
MVQGPRREHLRPGAALSRIRLAGIALVLALALGACRAGDEGRLTEVRPAKDPPTTVAAPPVTQAPPPIVVRGGGRELRLEPWSYCWSGAGSGVCADGHPPGAPPDAGNAEELEVAFAAPGFRFVATAEQHGVRCGRSQTVSLPAVGPTTHRLAPIGPAGDYVITLAGRSTETAVHKGDVITTFRSHTPRAGANEPPAATASILAGRPPDVLSFGVEVGVRDLRATPGPGRARASVVVTSADGAALTIDLERRTVDCAPEGSVSFGAPKALGERAARLGPSPFRYDLTLVLDSATYRGTATWPDDVDPACSPCTPLRFTPSLPGL